jgi:hypothetical protein
LSWKYIFYYRFIYKLITINNILMANALEKNLEELRNSEGKQPFMHCPRGHRVYIRAWNRYSDVKRGITDGRKCRECDRIYDTKELS